MFTSQSNALRRFHQAVGDGWGRLTDEDRGALRARMHEEENDELIEALEEGDRAHIARELADVVFVAYGTADAFGIDLDTAFGEVVRANMSKVDGPGLPILREDGKVMKPDGFVPPDMKDAI